MTVRYEKALRLANSLPLTDSHLALNFHRHAISLSILIDIIMLTGLLNFITASVPLHQSSGPDTHDFLPMLIPILSKPFPYARVNPHLYSFIHFIGELLNSLPLSVFFYCL